MGLLAAGPRAGLAEPPPGARESRGRDAPPREGRADLAPGEVGEDEAFPSSRDYFEAMAADPTEPGYGGRYVLQVGGDRFGEVMIGDYVGIYRWRLSPEWGVQANLGGGALARFNLTTAQNSMEVVDFTGAFPVDIRRTGGHTLRAGLWHTSSHLGDDLIKRQNPVLIKRSLDMVKLIYAWAPGSEWRLYGGWAWAINALGVPGRGALQAGAEGFGPRILRGTARPFAAQDLQLHERVGWNPSYNLRAGVRFDDAKRIAAARLFLEYFSGRQYFLQFLETHESRWTLGLNFEIGNPTR